MLNRKYAAVITVLLAAAFFAAIGLLLLIGLLTYTPPENPFADYAAYMPGMPRPTTPRCVPEYSTGTAYAPPMVFYCRWDVGSEVLRTVFASGHTSAITRLRFAVRLRYGDLVALYGRADRTRRCGQSTCFWWSNTMYAQGSGHNPDSMRTPINTVVFHEG